MTTKTKLLPQIQALPRRRLEWNAGDWLIAGSLAVLLVCAISLLGGCAAVQKGAETVADYHKGACEMLGEENKAQIEAEAQRAGISLIDAYKGFQKSCEVRSLVGAKGAVGIAVGSPPDECAE